MKIKTPERCRTQNIITYTVVILANNFVSLILLEIFCTEGLTSITLTVWENRAGSSDTILSAAKVHGSSQTIGSCCILHCRRCWMFDLFLIRERVSPHHSGCVLCQQPQVGLFRKSFGFAAVQNKTTTPAEAWGSWGRFSCRFILSISAVNKFLPFHRHLVCRVCLFYWLNIARFTDSHSSRWRFLKFTHSCCKRDSCPHTHSSLLIWKSLINWPKYTILW